MRRVMAGAAVVAALMITASGARAEESKAGRGCPLSTEELTALDDLSAETPALAGQRAGEARGAIAVSAPEGLTDGEMGELEKLAAESPELADQAGGYLSDDDLVTVLLIVLIVVLIT